MKKFNAFIDKIILNRLFYFIITIIFLGCAILLFCWSKKCFDLSKSIDYNLFGTLGDYIGGVLGTIFMLLSCLLLVRTFRQQQVVTEGNKQQLESQRFNDLFFELMGLYQKQVSEMCGQETLSESSDKSDDYFKPEKVFKYNDKDFFDVAKDKLKDNFVNGTSLIQNRYRAIRHYMDFYIENKTKLGAYFRTLYRIYDLVDNANLDGEIKKDYLKIVRAQLTESELFLLRYNAMTYYGENFIAYINKYNILKHLPIFELLEFKDWWNVLNAEERMGLDMVFDYIYDEIREYLESADKDVNNYLMPKKIDNLSHKYFLVIETKKKYDIKVSIKIKEKVENNKKELNGLDKFDNKKIQQLLDCYIKELFIYSNFEKFNLNSNIETYSSQIFQENDVIMINSGIRNKQKEPLHFTNKLLWTKKL